MTSKELSKWSDSFMFKAEESNAADGPSAILLQGPADPLGGVVACVRMYKGQVTRDLADVTDEERANALIQVQKTILGMPLEAVQLHFMIEGVTRSLTHQAVRQRTAAYAQESMRFAVKEDMASAVAYPPSLDGTKSISELVEADIAHRQEIGLQMDPTNEQWMSNLVDGLHQQSLDGKFGPAQKWRTRWDDGVQNISASYLDLINDGMPAEDARGLAVHNTTTRYNYITNLRNFYGEMAKRLSDQAQFEWRLVAMNLALAMRRFGEVTSYLVWIEDGEDLKPGDNPGVTGTGLDRRMNVNTGKEEILVRRSSYWQYVALSNEMKPTDFIAGRRTFAADFDRPSRIGERVDEFAKNGIPSSEWTKGSVEHGIPPIHPAEWLLDPNSARLAEGQEFDVFGNRVPAGTGWHFVSPGVLGRAVNGKPQAARWPRDFDDNGYTDANKPGVSDEDVAKVVDGL